MMEDLQWCRVAKLAVGVVGVRAVSFFDVRHGDVSFLSRRVQGWAKATLGRKH